MMSKRTYFSKLLPGEVFEPPGHPEYRCLKVGHDYYMSLCDCKLHWDDDMEYFADCGDIFTDNDMFVEVIYKDGEWKIVPREEGHEQNKQYYLDGVNDAHAAMKEALHKNYEELLRRGEI